MKLIIPALLSVLLSACAFSPQQITIKPDFDVISESYGAGRPLSISVEDARENKILGSRGGIYEETSLITLKNSLTDAIAGAARAKLATQGFNVNSNDPDAAAVKIKIEKLSYDLPKDAVGRKVLLESVLSVEASLGGESYTGRYKTNSERHTLVSPTMGRNEEMINTLLSDTLVRLFSDPKLKAFLNNI